MRSFRRKSRQFHDLESELRRTRPSPSEDVVDGVVAKVAAAGASHRGRVARPRATLGVAFLAVGALVFASFGGIGYAKSAAGSAVTSTAQAVTAVVSQPASKKQSTSQAAKAQNDPQGPSTNANGNGSGQSQYTDKVLICHNPPGPRNPQTISVSQSAVAAHLAHGDTLGPCPNE